MPAQNPLTVTSVTKQQRRLVNDMALRNDMFFNQDVFTSVARIENPMSPFWFLSKVLGGEGGEVEAMFEPVGQGIGSEFIKILEESDFQEHARILDTSKVPDRLFAGANFDVTIDKPLADPDEAFMTRNEQTMFRVESRRNSPSGQGSDYTLQLIGIPGTSVPGAYLRVNDPLMIGFGNSKGEGSLNSNTVIDDLTERSQFFNLSTIARYGFNETGSAMADLVYTMAITKSLDGTSTEELVATSLPVKYMRQVLKATDHALMYNVPNFDPKTRKIANRSAQGRNSERPFYAGIYWQLDQCPWKWRHQTSQSDAEGINKLDFILEFMRERLGGKPVLYAMCTGIGRKWLKHTILTGGLRKYGINIWQEVKGGDKLPIGFEADEYITDAGRIVVYDIGVAMNNWDMEYDRSTYNGISYANRSADIYFIPAAMKTANGVKKRPAKIFFKQGNGVSRAFTFGYMDGIHGGKNGYTAQQLLNMQDSFVQQNMGKDSFRLDSTVDGREFHCLTQLVPYMDVRNVTKLTLYK